MKDTSPLYVLAREIFIHSETARRSPQEALVLAANFMDYMDEQPEEPEYWLIFDQKKAEAKAKIEKMKITSKWSSNHHKSLC